jgi:hypothetical protein
MQWRGCEGSDRPSGYDKGDPQYRLLPKSRNGFSAETVCGEIGDVTLVISHDRWRSAPNSAVRFSADLTRPLSAIEFTCKSSPYFRPARSSHCCFAIRRRDRGNSEVELAASKGGLVIRG